jgi:hypothetical protein
MEASRMSSIADATAFLGERVNRADIDAAAKALLFAMELKVPPAHMLAGLGRLLHVLGYEGALPGAFGDIARLVLRLARAAHIVPTDVELRLGTVDLRTLSRLARRLDGKLQITPNTPLGPTRLYVVVLCLARLGDGAPIH